MTLALDAASAAQLLERANTLSDSELARLLDDLDELARKDEIARARSDFLAFCRMVYPEFLEGPHHRYLSPLLHDMCAGDLLRLTVSLAPRFGKSITCAYLFVAWFLGHHPNEPVLMLTHTAALSADFGRQVRNLIDSPEYQAIFPGTQVSKDKAAADNWATTAGGKYLALGVGGNVSGHGAALIVADDLCVHTDSIIYSLRGQLPAAEIQVGDFIRGNAGWQRVIRKTQSVHEQSVSVGVPGLSQPLRLSGEHPVWTHNRGWQRGCDLRTGDVLQTTSVLDKLWFSITRRIYARTEAGAFGGQVPTRVQHLGADEAALHQSEGSKLRELWRSWCACLTRVGQVCGLLAGYGPSAFAAAHAGQVGQHRKLRAGQLPVGDGGGAADQPLKCEAVRLQRAEVVVGADCSCGRYAGWVCAEHRAFAAAASDYAVGHDARRSSVLSEAELGAAPRHSKEFGWMRSCAARIIGRRSNAGAQGAVATLDEAQGWGGAEQGAVERRGLQRLYLGGYKVWEAALGLLLGIRRVASVTSYDSSEERFVNFEVEGDNTFFTGGILTHNCSEQAVLANPDIAFENAWSYFQVGPLQRLHPGGRILMIGTRWGQKDPIGRALQWAQDNPGSVKWREVRFPALMHVERDGEMQEVSLWPARWPLAELQAKRAGMMPAYWAASYLQEPTSEGAAIIKRDWWQVWPESKPPYCEYIITSWDTAHDTKSHNDYSACITLGVFHNEITGRNEVILLNAFRGRWEFPQLKEHVLSELRHWKPDCLLIEKKAAGAPLIQELRQSGIAVQEYSPSRGKGGVSNDKRARMNSVAPLFFDKIVWCPDTKWAWEVVEEVAGFPAAQNDDEADALVQAIHRLRSSGVLALNTDVAPTEDFSRPDDEEAAGRRRPRTRTPYY